MKQIIILLLCALPFGAAAQTTPEAIIGQCPNLPSVAHLAARFDNETAQAAIQEFFDELKVVREAAIKASELAQEGTKEAAISDAERIAKQETGKSVTELQNMSDAEAQAMAQKLVGQKMSAAGLGNMSLKDLQALEGKSNAEIMATMTGNIDFGLTPQEIKAMEGMSDKQIEAYMKKGDRMQRMQAAGVNAAGSPKIKQTDAQTKKALSQTAIVDEINRIKERWNDIDNLCKKETQEVAVKIAEIKKRYRSQIDAIPRSGLIAGHESVYTQSEEKAVTRLRIACDTECYTLWRNQISKIQGRIKTKMPDAYRMDELTSQSFAAGGMTAMGKINIHGYVYSIADQYLDIAANVTSLPLIIED
ncbi:MAG: hypothetical protein LBN74_09965, partial [Prevotella sp.]|jgi:hypothetical protein|nr:hypothetical protein [Prevotella sp.]